MKSILFLLSLCFLLSVSLLFQEVMADKKPPERIPLALEGAKFPPVDLSHPIHVDKAKIECSTCHHKDKNPKEPSSCLTCHPVKDPTNNAPIAKDAFHKQCITCHQENVSKGIVVPAKCNECHKKQ